ncbi:arginase family protein [Brachybacterium sacelli]|uniref:Arginase n=1 Tax=Brachybacterium sacelli TaxID=173364 RepID=A0ABS4WVW4_9MICO|nr:arginase family protein [Brachybacterium sacelli]MBP2380340.1 arginase [Brachybacterium sacelli]
MTVLHVLGVPSSAASYAPGQEQAPRALREAGLLDALTASGWQVEDAGDLTMQVWSPDRARPFAQNLTAVASSVRELAARVASLTSSGERLLVLGGNCTVALGMCAGLRDSGLEPHLVYIDRHFDLNTPESTREGALDWMGVAHGLAVEGSADELLDALGPRPLLVPGQVSFLGVEVDGATGFEREQADRLHLPVVPLHDLVAAPRDSARTARSALPDEPFAVHLDVDVLDFIDAPLAENVNGRNSGPTVDQLGEALGTLWQDPGCRALSIGELNPVHARADPAALPRFIDTLADALAT